MTSAAASTAMMTGRYDMPTSYQDGRRYPSALRKRPRRRGLQHLVVRAKGLEPSWGCPHMDLNHTRLPIPPRPRSFGSPKCGIHLNARAPDRARTILTRPLTPGRREPPARRQRARCPSGTARRLRRGRRGPPGATVVAMSRSASTQASLASLSAHCTISYEPSMPWASSRAATSARRTDDVATPHRTPARSSSYKRLLLEFGYPAPLSLPARPAHGHTPRPAAPCHARRAPPRHGPPAAPSLAPARPVRQNLIDWSSRGRGGIGIRRRLKIFGLRDCGFESHRPYHACESRGVHPRRRRLTSKHLAHRRPRAPASRLFSLTVSSPYPPARMSSRMITAPASITGARLGLDARQLSDGRAGSLRMRSIARSTSSALRLCRWTNEAS